MKKRIVICTAIAVASLMGVVLLALTLSAAYDPATYGEAARAAYGLADAEVTQAVGLTEEAQEALAGEIAQYLRGKRAELDVEADVLDLGTAETRRQPAFNARERAHMADVRGLLDLAGRLMGALALTALIAATAAQIAMKKSDGREAARACFTGTWAGALILAVPVLALAVWGAADFTSLFWAFHSLAFTNDLWLLNPATDLLIRMMPEGLFVGLAASIAAKACAVLAALLLAAGLRVLWTRKRGGRKAE